MPAPTNTITGFNNGKKFLHSAINMPSVIPSTVWTDAIEGKIMIDGAGQFHNRITDELMKQLSLDPDLKTILDGLYKVISNIKNIPEDMRKTIILASMSIGYYESGGFNPIAVSGVQKKLTDMVAATKEYSHSKATGFWQLLPSTFRGAASIFNDPKTAWKDLVDKLGIIKTMEVYNPDQAEALKNVGQISHFDFSDPSTQVIPAIILLSENANRIFKEWKWDELEHKWLPIKPAANIYTVSTIENAVPGALSDKELGFQVLMTTYHINGNVMQQAHFSGLAYKELPGNKNRYAIDVANYLKLQQVITWDTIKELFTLTTQA